MRNLGGNFFEKCDGQCCQNLTYHCFWQLWQGISMAYKTPQQKKHKRNMVQLKFLGPFLKEIPIGNQPSCSESILPRYCCPSSLASRSHRPSRDESANLWLAILTCWGLFTQKVHLDLSKTQAIYIKSSTSKTGWHSWHLTPDLDTHSSHEKNPLPHLTLRPCHLHSNGPWHLRGQSCCPGNFSFRRQPKLQLGSCRKGRNRKPCVVEIPPFFLPFSQIS